MTATPPHLPMSMPPTIRTRPSASRVAVGPSRGVPIEPIGLKIPAAGVVDLGRRTAPASWTVAPVPARDQDPSVREQRRRLLLPTFLHRAGRAERAGSRVVQLSADTDGVLRRSAPEDQHAPVREQRRGVEPAAEPHGAARAERAGRRVVDVGDLPGGAGLATVSHDEDATVLEQGRRMAAMGRAHRIGLAEGSAWPGHRSRRSPGRRRPRPSDTRQA